MATVAVASAASTRAVNRRLGRVPLAVLRQTGRGGVARPVTASDGTRLHVEIDGPDDAPLTVVFSHGVALDLTMWRRQREALTGSPVRRVFYDHRGHGLSERGPVGAVSARRLGEDLHAVIEAVAPSGPVALVGHSMGGMTIMALAGAHPEQFGARIKATLLVNTSSGELDKATLGLPPRIAQLFHEHIAEVCANLACHPELTRAAGLAPYRLMVRQVCHPSTSRRTRRTLAALISAMPLEVLGEFIDKLRPFSELVSLPTLGRARTVILAGDRDIVTPRAHAEVLAHQIPGAALIEVARCGHLLPLEHPHILDGHIAEMIASVAPA